MVVLGWAPLAGMFVGAAMVGVTAGLASALLSGRLTTRSCRWRWWDSERSRRERASGWRAP
jgi:hypothetical protein